MKAMKKIMAVLITLALVMTLVPAAFATAPTGSVITAPANVSESASHTYNLYQIFTGDPTDNAGELENVVWGANGTGDAGTAVDAAVLEALTDTSLTTDAAKLAVITQYVSMTNPSFTVAAGGSVTVPFGYYLIEDVITPAVDVDDAVSLYVVKVAASEITITPKVGTPSVEKKVKDTNDTDGTTSDWQDSADHDIGDTVQFQLTADLTDAPLADYATYFLEFVDDMCDGLSYTGVTSISLIHGATTTDVSSYFTVAHSAGHLTVTSNDIKAAGAVQGDKIVVEFNATLNSNAVIGRPGNPNQVYLRYSNNPNVTGEGAPTGKTPEDVVIVFTYKVVVNKVDANNEELVGAHFELFKKVPGDPNADKDGWVSLGEQGAASAISTFSWEGLDDGDYKLVETQKPSEMYNDIDDILFTVTAGHVVLSPNPTLESLTGDADSGEVTFTPNVDAGSLTTTVVNRTGATLPTTGGMGTTLFYVIGSIMVICAGVLLVSKKRMAAID